MRRDLTLPIVGVAAAIAITTTMDATGWFMFSALPLFPLMLIFWWLDRLTRTQIGLRVGRTGHYLLALLYPLLIMGAIATLASIGGAMDLSQTDWGKAGMNVALVGLSTM